MGGVPGRGKGGGKVRLEGFVGEEEVWGGGYQFAATMGLLLMLKRLDLGFWRILGREDLFFFFWMGPPIVSLV